MVHFQFSFKENQLQKKVLKVAFLMLFLLLFSYFGYSLFEKQSVWGGHTQNIVRSSKAKKQILAINSQKLSVGLPKYLIIPAINVNANIQHLGINAKGEMDVPNNIIDVGWFKFGSRPGEKGSAVIDGHLDGKNGEAGVFFNLYKLKKGDTIYVKDDKGMSIAFVVRESRMYNPGSADDVFNRSDKAHLNLITCAGVWDIAKSSYNKRLIVFADIVN